MSEANSEQKKILEELNRILCSKKTVVEQKDENAVLRDNIHYILEKIDGTDAYFKTKIRTKPNLDVKSISEDLIKKITTTLFTNTNTKSIKDVLDNNIELAKTNLEALKIIANSDPKTDLNLFLLYSHGQVNKNIFKLPDNINIVFINSLDYQTQCETSKSFNIIKTEDIINYYKNPTCFPKETNNLFNKSVIYFGGQYCIDLNIVIEKKTEQSVDKPKPNIMGMKRNKTFKNNKNNKTNKNRSNKNKSGNKTKKTNKTTLDFQNLNNITPIGESENTYTNTLSEILKDLITKNEYIKPEKHYTIIVTSCRDFENDDFESNNNFIYYERILNITNFVVGNGNQSKTKEDLYKQYLECNTIKKLNPITYEGRLLRHTSIIRNQPKESGVSIKASIIKQSPNTIINIDGYDISYKKLKEIFNNNILNTNNKLNDNKKIFSEIIKGNYQINEQELYNNEELRKLIYEFSHFVIRFFYVANLGFRCGNIEENNQQIECINKLIYGLLYTTDTNIEQLQNLLKFIKNQTIIDKVLKINEIIKNKYSEQIFNIIIKYLESVIMYIENLPFDYRTIQN
jgi:hypothetical protein